MAGCSSETEETNTFPEFDTDNGGITLPDGFEAYVVADSLGSARHLTVADNGDLYVAIRNTNEGQGGIIGLRDTNGDGRADMQVEFGHDGGTGIDHHKGYLYFASDTSVVRYAMNEGELLPDEDYEVIAHGFIEESQHAVKPFTFDDEGGMYVNVGAPSNACQEESRTPNSPGQDPCPLLEQYGGIWKFADDQLNQHQDDATRYASGIRNAVALDVNPDDGQLYIVQHGRDQLNTLWGDLYDEQDNAELPAEEFVRLSEGEERPWPYCYYDPIQESYVLSPEYGGDGMEVGRCADYEEPLVGFPAHFAPNDIIFYQADQFPEEYQGGAFIAFHGSWNRAPEPQDGYKVVHVPFTNGQIEGDGSDFANDFMGQDEIQNPSDAEYRPMGLATGPDGSLYISDSQVGRIWRIIYTGN